MSFFLYDVIKCTLSITHELLTRGFAVGGGFPLVNERVRHKRKRTHWHTSRYQLHRMPHKNTSATQHNTTWPVYLTRISGNRLEETFFLVFHSHGCLTCVRRKATRKELIGCQLLTGSGPAAVLSLMNQTSFHLIFALRHTCAMQS